MTRSGRVAADGSVTCDETVAHAVSIVEATELPVSADLKNAFADERAGVADTMRLALEAGRCSVEDFTGREEDATIYDAGLANSLSVKALEGGRSVSNMVGVWPETPVYLPTCNG